MPSPKKRKVNHVVKETVNHNLCIGCGICHAICPDDAINMVLNRYNETVPCIDKKKCTDCGICVKFCPNTKSKIQKEAVKISGKKVPHQFGLDDADYFVAWSSNTSMRQKCCSGGVVTSIALKMLESGLIDGMVHVERLWGGRNELHYGARLSTTPEEIAEHVSSAYQPVDFSDVLLKLEPHKTYFITGTPCVIRGLKYLFKAKRYNNIKIITCALICSHIVNPMFVDFFADAHKIPDTKKWKVNFRNKDNIPDANNYNNHIYTANGDLLKINRFESFWTDFWRSYYFAMNVCLYCSDFWGYEADVSIKDAWGKWASDPLGKSIVVLRNKELLPILKDSGIIFEELDWDTIKDHQKPTPVFKQTQAYNKNFKHFISRSNRRNGLFKYKLISFSSKFMYKYLGFKGSHKIIKTIKKISEKLEKR